MLNKTNGFWRLNRTKRNACLQQIGNTNGRVRQEIERIDQGQSSNNNQDRRKFKSEDK